MGKWKYLHEMEKWEVFLDQCKTFDTFLTDLLRLLMSYSRGQIRKTVP